MCTFKVINTNKGHEVNKDASSVFSSNAFGKALLLKMVPSMFATLLLHLVLIFFQSIAFPHHVVFSFGFTLLVPIINFMVCNLCCRFFFLYSCLVESLIEALRSLPSLPKHNRRYILFYILKIKCIKNISYDIFSSYHYLKQYVLKHLKQKCDVCEVKVIIYNPNHYACSITSKIT